MRDQFRRRRGGSSRRPVVLLVVSFVAAVSIGACGGSTTPAPVSTSSPTPSPGASSPPVVVATGEPGSSDGPTAQPVSQTETAWGRIWDALPPAFGVIRDSTPTETGEGPATAELFYGGSVEDGVDAVQAALRAAGVSVVIVGSALEDGGRVLDGAGPGDCQAQASVGPRGRETLIRVLYGADCPFG